MRRVRERKNCKTIVLGARELTRGQMSVQARRMGIADIFEALTVKDRPYKKARPCRSRSHLG
jgi:hypothetical protein